MMFWALASSTLPEIATSWKESFLPISPLRKKNTGKNSGILVPYGSFMHVFLVSISKKMPLSNIHLCWLVENPYDIPVYWLVNS